MAKLFANSGDPDQTLRTAASDLDMHCLPAILLGLSRLQWVNKCQGPLLYQILQVFKKMNLLSATPLYNMMFHVIFLLVLVVFLFHTYFRCKVCPF